MGKVKMAFLATLYKSIFQLYQFPMGKVKPERFPMIFGWFEYQFPMGKVKLRRVEKRSYSPG